MAGVDGRTRERLLEISGFLLGSFPFRYLGIPLAAERLRTADYSALIEAVVGRLTSWPRRTLSDAGKLELVRTLGIECFWLSIFPVPSGLIDRLHLPSFCMDAEAPSHLMGSHVPPNIRGLIWSARP